MVNTVYARPVLPLAISLMSGIVSGSWFCGYGTWAYGLAAVSAVVIILTIKQGKTAVVSPIVLFAALGYLCLQPWAAPVVSPHHLIHFIDSHPRQIVGTISGRPVASPHRERFTLRVETIGTEAATAFAAGNIAVSVWGTGSGLSIGDRISFFSKIRSIRNFNNPGRFDYKRHMNFKKIWGSAHVQAKQVKVLKKDAAQTPFRRIQSARNHISALIEKTGEGQHQGVLKALITGDRSDVSPAMRAAFNRAGVGHLLAISGLHVGIVAAAAFFFFQRLLSMVKFFLWRAWTRKGAALLTLVPVFAYGLLAGMSPSTQRAVIMVTVFLLSFMLESEQNLLNTLSLAAVIILIIHPPALFTISFQLSFSAVVLIVYGLSRLPNISVNPAGHNRILKKLLVFVLVSFFAIVGTLPLVMRYFNQVSLVGLLSNILFIPLIGFIVVPLGLMAAFVSFAGTSGALWCLKAGAWILDPALDLINVFATLPFAATKTITPNGFEMICYYGLVWALLNLKREPMLKSGEGRHLPDSETGCDNVNDNNHSMPEDRRLRREVKQIRNQLLRIRLWATSRQHRPVIVLALVLLTVFADAGYWIYRRLWHSDLRVTIIDVGQGSAALLELPKGYNLLIDGGGFSDNASFDVGARIVAPLLWQKKITTVDTLILSHPNSDHLNGLVYIAEHFKVKQVWTNSQASPNRGYQQFITVIEQNRIDRPGFKDIPRDLEIGGVRLKILYPTHDVIQKTQTQKNKNYNNNSMVVQVGFGSKTLLFPGDIMFPAEEALVSFAGGALRSTVLVAPHHGSRKSSSDLFLDAVEPEVVVISTGWNNRFQLPHPSVLNKYRKRGYRIYRTDTNGAVTITTDGRELTVRPFMAPSG